MRKLLVAFIALFTLVQVSSAQQNITRTNILTWDNPNPWTDTSNFVFMAFSAGGTQVGKATAVTNTLPFISFMGSSPNGSYFVNGITFANSGLSSDPSTNFTFQWFGTIAIQNQPQSLTVLNGQVATFTVTTFGGAGTVSYQWARNGSIVPGATSASLILTSAKPSDNGTYTVAASDTTGTVTSQGAILTVIPKPNSPVGIRVAP
jgi:hypothetical protein